MSDKPEMPDWDDLQDIWRDSPATDMVAMARHARLVWWRMRVNFAIELVLCLVGMGFFGGEILKGAQGIILAFHILFFAFCAGGVWAAFHIRKGAWGEPDGTALSLVTLQIRRSRSAIRYVRINNWGCLAAIPLIALAFHYVDLKRGGLTLEKDLIVYILVGAYALLCVLFPILTRRYVRRKKALIAELEAVAEQLNDRENDPI